MLSALLLLVLFTGPLASEPSQEILPGEAGDLRGQNPLREYIRLNMELGQFYLMSGNYDLAAERFLTVTRFDIPDDRDRTQQIDQRRQDSNSAREGRFERRQRRAQRRHNPRQTQQKAFLHAAVATYLMGDTATALAIAQEGLSRLPEEGAIEETRPHRRVDGARLQRFIENPEALAERVAPGPEGMEARLLEIEAELSENGTQ